MKKIVTLLTLALTAFLANGQTSIADFETFTLSPNSFYKDTNSVPFQTTNAVFRYSWDKPFSYWDGGFSYTNKQDSTNGNFSNLYNCRALKGYNNSNFYVTGKDHGIIKIKSPYNKVDGFYITNTTYAYKSMKNGDAFAKKFGGPSGNDPDWFKITAKGYLNGSLKSDSSEFYLADYRFSNNANDYIVQGWQWFNTANLGQVDSIQFFMYSSDVGSFGINTPLFFSIDDFTTSQSFVGIAENSIAANLFLYPNPTNGNLNIDVHQNVSNPIGIRIMEISGKEVYTKTTDVLMNSIDLNFLNLGIYFVEVTIDDTKLIKRVTKF